MQRIHSLDGLRGLAAICVALMHFPIQNLITGSNFISNSYLFVDLFFVLSGYVVTFNIYNQNSLKEFIFKRLKRLLPIYYFTLICGLLFELTLHFLPNLSDRVAFTGVTSIWAFISELLLYQAYPFVENSSFNPPNWSISTEIFLYLVLAINVFYIRKKKLIFIIALLGCFLGNFILFGNYWNNAHELAIYRGIAGFSVGYLVFCISEYCFRKNFVFNNWLLFIWIIVSCLYIQFDGLQHLEINSIAFPSLVFGILICFIVNGNSRSVIQEVLSSKWLVWLGILSYPLYLVHYLIAHRIEDTCKIFSINQCAEYSEVTLIFYISISLVSAQMLISVIEKFQKRR